MTQNLFHISNCIAEILFDFLIGGLTLQICLVLGDAIINCVLDCNAAHLTIEKLVEGILEPIVFVGGFFSIYLFVTAKNRTLKAQQAKYTAIGNLIGSSIAVFVATYLCFQAEEFVVPNTTTVAPVQRDVDEVVWNRSAYEPLEHIENMYDKKNSILAMNMFARMFAEIFVKCFETFTHKIHEVFAIED